MCVVCWERPADHVLVPCGHLCLCDRCPERLGAELDWQCPIGKCDVHAAMRVYHNGVSGVDGDGDGNDGDGDGLPQGRGMGTATATATATARAAQRIAGEEPRAGY